MVRSLESILIVSGERFHPDFWKESPSIERLDFEGDEIVNQDVIGSVDASTIPVLFESSADFCV